MPGVGEGDGTGKRSLRGAALGLALVLSPLSAPPVAAQSAPTGPFFTSADLVLAGSAALGGVLLHQYDARLADAVRAPAPQSAARLRRTANAMREWGFPGTVVSAAVLYVGGRLGGNERMATLGLRAGEALAGGMAVGTAGKYLAGRARPSQGHHRSGDFDFGRGFESEQFRSMPSGHTLAAFAFAAGVTKQVGEWWSEGEWIVGAVTYSAATLTGLSRMYHDRHWATDALAGAAIGTLAGRTLVRFHAGHPNNSLDGWMLSLNLAPAAGGAWTTRLLVSPNRRLVTE
jgi:membrane-associated phospholipid phosphatase